jgi:hypothetical protein
VRCTRQGKCFPFPRPRGTTERGEEERGEEEKKERGRRKGGVPNFLVKKKGKGV